jgi:hypothetical protein
LTSIFAGSGEHCEWDPRSGVTAAALAANRVETGGTGRFVATCGEFEMSIHTKSAAMIAAAIAIGFAAPAAFAADQMSNSHDSASSTMAPDKGKDAGMAHPSGDGMAHTGSPKMSGGDAMAHPGSGKMSSGSTTGGTAMSHDNAMSHDTMSK